MAKMTLERKHFVATAFKLSIVTADMHNDSIGDFKMSKIPPGFNRAICFPFLASSNIVLSIA